MGDKVYSKNFGQGPKWMPGVIAESTGPVSFLVRLGSGQVIRRHQDHLRKRHNDLDDDSSKEEGMEVEFKSATEGTAEIVQAPLMTDTTTGRAEVEEPVDTSGPSVQATPQVEQSCAESTPPVQQTPIRTLRFIQGVLESSQTGSMDLDRNQTGLNIQLFNLPVQIRM